MPPGPLAVLRVGAGAFWVADAALRVYAVQLPGAAALGSALETDFTGGGSDDGGHPAELLAREVAAAAAEARGGGSLAARSPPVRSLPSFFLAVVGPGLT